MTLDIQRMCDSAIAEECKATMLSLWWGKVKRSSKLVRFMTICTKWWTNDKEGGNEDGNRYISNYHQPAILWRQTWFQVKFSDVVQSWINNSQPEKQVVPSTRNVKCVFDLHRWSSLSYDISTGTGAQSTNLTFHVTCAGLTSKTSRWRLSPV